MTLLTPFRYLRVPVPHRHPFQCGDRVAYRTVSLCEETWNPIISDIYEGVVREQSSFDNGSSEVVFTIESSNDPYRGSVSVTWNDISEAWLLVDRSTVPASPLLNGSQQSDLMSDEQEVDLKQKKASLLSLFA
jgi:hypothetical protein